MTRKPSSSQDAWTRGEALERAGRAKEALDLYIRAAIAEEDARRPLRARLLWEQVGKRTGPSGTLLERLGAVCVRAQLDEDAFDYWVAAAAHFQSEGRAEDAARARTHAEDLRRRIGRRPVITREVPPLAAEVLRSHRALVQDLLTPGE